MKKQIVFAALMPLDPSADTFHPSWRIVVNNTARENSAERF
jgi:hypothetical protein